jgi:hypothetical protein
MRTLQRVGAGLLALTLAGGVTACGSDDAATTDTTEASGSDGGTTAGDDAAFCGAVVDFNSAVFEVELDESSSTEDIKAAGDGLLPIFTTVVDNAPESVADLASELNDSLTPLADGDATAFNADSTFETFNQFVAAAVEACDFASVEVTASDYAFEAPSTIDAGDVSFALSNTSAAEDHEMVIMRKAAGVDLSFEEVLALPEDEGESKAEFVGFAMAPPGESGSSLAALEPGSYALVCFLPVGGAEDGPPHFTQGMLHEFTVE